MSRDAHFSGTVPALYDRHLGPLLFVPYARDLAGRIAVPDGGCVLELACGTGLLTHALAGQLEGRASIMATDLNEPMLEVARAHVVSDCVTWKHANAMTLPFADAEFDAVVCQFGVMFFPDKAAAAREVRRVLKPGRRFIFNVWGPLDENPLGSITHAVILRLYPSDPPMFLTVPWGYGDSEQVERDLRAGGFTDIRIESLPLVASAPSPLEAAIGIVQGSPLADGVRARGTVPIEEVTRQVADALGAAYGHGLIRMPMTALVVQAA